jgi:hypothetical protein
MSAGPRRLLLVVSLLWAAGVSGIVIYERFTVDPWSFLGEDRGAIFFRWAPYLDYSKSAFGDFALVLDTPRFCFVLLGPVLALGVLSIFVPLLVRRRRNIWQGKPHTRSH